MRYKRNYNNMRKNRFYVLAVTAFMFLTGCSNESLGLEEAKPKVPMLQLLLFQLTKTRVPLLSTDAKKDSL